MTVFTKCDGFITKCNSYYNMAVTNHRQEKDQSFLSIKNNILHVTTWDRLGTSCSKTGIYEILCNTQQVMNTTTQLRSSQSKLEAW